MNKAFNGMTGKCSVIINDSINYKILSSFNSHINNKFNVCHFKSIFQTMKNVKCTLKCTLHFKRYNKIVQLAITIMHLISNFIGQLHLRVRVHFTFFIVWNIDLKWHTLNLLLKWLLIIISFEMQCAFSCCSIECLIHLININSLAIDSNVFLTIKTSVYQRRYQRGNHIPQIDAGQTTQWPNCSTCRKDFLVLSSFMICHWVCN
jgi:hypothetical protein